MAKSGYKGVSRIDCPERKTVGWYVRVRLNKVTKSKFISDKAHGGKDAALQKAVECRNQLEKELGKPIRRQKELEMYGTVVVSKWADTLSKVCAA